LKVVVDHPLGGARAFRDSVDSRAAQAIGSELLGGHGENIRLGALGIIGKHLGAGLGRGFLLPARHPNFP
jgi:hypothetical protein